MAARFARMKKIKIKDLFTAHDPARSVGDLIVCRPEEDVMAALVAAIPLRTALRSLPGWPEQVRP
jgi:hypothetical protein